MTTHDPEPSSRRIKGRTIVISLLIFGLVMSGSLYVFQAINTYPFAETQQALAQKFPKSRPRVEGGRLKGKEINPLTFRVTLAVDFNPIENQSRIDALADQVLLVAREHLNLNEYEVAELHFYQPIPEQQILMRDLEIDLADWQKQH